MKAVLLALVTLTLGLIACGNDHELVYYDYPFTDYYIFRQHIYCPSASREVYLREVEGHGTAEVCEWECAYVTHPRYAEQETVAFAQVFYWLNKPRGTKETWYLRFNCGD